MPLISSLIAAAAQWDGDPKDILDDLFCQVQLQWNGRMLDVTYTGNRYSVGEFLAWFIDLVKKEKPKGRLTDERLKALKRVHDFLRLHTNTNFFHRAFECVDPYKFLIQLIFRIRKPEMINQRKNGFCGPSALIASIARNRPVDLTILALGIFMNGHAMLDGLEVDAPILIRRHYHSSQIGEFEHVVLGSLRNSAAVLLPRIASGWGSITSPALLCSWLKSAGYEVWDHTFFDVMGTMKNVIRNLESTEYPHDELLHGTRNPAFRVPSNRDPRVALLQKNVILRRMASDLRAGQNVIMLAHSAVCWNATEPLLPSPVHCHLLTHLHWTYVNKCDLILPEVNLKVCTWGGVVRRYHVPIETFLSQYAGYVSFRDLRT